MADVKEAFLWATCLGAAIDRLDERQRESGHDTALREEYSLLFKQVQRQLDDPEVLFRLEEVANERSEWVMNEMYQLGMQDSVCLLQRMKLLE